MDDITAYQMVTGLIGVPQTLTGEVILIVLAGLITSVSFLLLVGTILYFLPRKRL